MQKEFESKFFKPNFCKPGPDESLQTRFDVFQQDVTHTLAQILKAYSSLQSDQVKIQKKLTNVVVSSNFEMYTELLDSKLKLLKQDQDRYNAYLKSQITKDKTYFQDIVKAEILKIEHPDYTTLESDLQQIL